MYLKRNFNQQNLISKCKRGIFDKDWFVIVFFCRYIYWVSNGYLLCIERVDMDGKNQIVILELIFFLYISGLIFEYLVFGQICLYYSEVIVSEVYYIEIVVNGSVFFIISQFNYLIDFIIFGSKLYLIDIGGVGIWDSGIYSVVFGDFDNVF